MSVLPALVRLWLSRLVWLVVIVVGITLLLHLRTAYELVEVPTDPLRHEERFSWMEYRTQLSEYLANLRAGKVEYYSNRGTRQQFLPVVRDGLGASFRLFAAAVVAGGVAGVLLGCLVALRHWLPRGFALTVSVAGLALPDFLVVLAGQAIAIWTYNAFDWKPWTVLADPSATRGMLLPMLALALLPMAYTARMTTSSLDEIMQTDYIRTARSKGLPERRVILGHALRNALPRLLSGLPIMLNVVLSSMLVVERMTAFPGLGQWLGGAPFVFTSIGPSGTLRVWAGAVPAVVVTVGAIMVAWFLLMDGLANTLRLLVNRRWQEVTR